MLGIIMENFDPAKDTGLLPVLGVGSMQTIIILFTLVTLGQSRVISAKANSGKSIRIVRC